MEYLESNNLVVEKYVNDENALVLVKKADDGSENGFSAKFLKIRGGLSGHFCVESSNEDNETLMLEELFKGFLKYKNEGVDKSNNRLVTCNITIRYAAE